MYGEGGIRIGKIFGIKINLDYSWFIIFAIITFGLAFILLPALIPGIETVTAVVLGIITSLLFFGSVLFHELMHSLVAIRNGIPIRGITLMLFGGVSQVQREPNTPGVEFKMTIAGPLSSLILGGIFLGLFFIANNLDLGLIFIVPLFWLGFVNLLLGAFNLLPGFPLDGGRVLRAGIWYATGDFKRATGIAAGVGKGFAYLLIFGGIAGPVLTGNLGFIWFALLGWYLLRAAEAEYRYSISRRQ